MIAAAMVLLLAQGAPERLQAAVEAALRRLDR
jgi:hypothetical protein